MNSRAKNWNDETTFHNNLFNFLTLFDNLLVLSYTGFNSIYMIIYFIMSYLFFYIKQVIIFRSCKFLKSLLYRLI